VFSLLRDIGEYISGSSTSIIEQISEPVGSDYVYGIALCFNSKGEYKGVRITKGSDNVIYKKGPSNGTDFTLVSRLGPSGISKTVKRIRKNAENVSQYFKGTEFGEYVINCLDSIDSQFLEIIDEIEEIMPQDIGQDRRVFFYWAKFNGEMIEGFYLLPEIQNYFVNTQMERYGMKKESKVPIETNNAICSVCGSLSEKVYGNFTEIACYNLDKIGVITGGFDYANASNNFPICQHCILFVLSGKKFTDKNLSFSLAGYPYWLLPQTTDPKLLEIITKAIEKSHSRQSLGKELDTITAKDDDILDLIVEISDSKDVALSLNFIFYDANLGSWRIKSEIREVLPSRIKELFIIKRKIQKYMDEKKYFPLSKKDRERGYYFTLKTIHPFCGDSDKRSEQKFLNYIEVIFKGKKLHEKEVLMDLSKGIIDAQKKDLKNASKYSIFRVRDAWATYIFLSKINSLDKEGVEYMPENKSMDVYSEYMNDNPDFFSDIYRRTAFLVGCYVNSVLYIQQSKRNSRPFEKKFLGRKLNGKILSNLYVDGRTKLAQYNSLGIVNKLDSILADSWVSCGDKWEITDEETTFAFSLGLSLGHKLIKNENKTNEVKK